MDRDEALAELQRRGVANPPADAPAVAPSISKTEALNELMRRKQPEKKSWNIFGDPEAFRNQVQDFEGKYGIAGANKMFTKIFGNKQMAEKYAQRAEEASKKYPKANKAGEILAGGYSSIPFFMTGGAAARTILPNAAPFAQNVLGGILGGGAIGATEVPLGDETRAGNMAFDATLGALAPGVGKALGYGAGKIAKGAKFLASETGKTVLDPSRLTYSNIAKQAEKSVADLVKKGSDKFKNVFQDTSKAGYGTLDNFKINPKLMNGLRKFAGKDDYDAALNRFLQDKTLDNAKKLSSDLFKFTRNYKKLPSTSKTSEGNLANKAAINFRKMLEDNIKNNIRKAGGDKLVSKYEGANKFWGDEVAGPADSSLLRKYQSKPSKLSDKDFVKDILKTKAGRAELKKLVPAATYRNLLNNVLKGGLVAAPILWGGSTVFDKIANPE